MHSASTDACTRLSTRQEKRLYGHPCSSSGNIHDPADHQTQAILVLRDHVLLSDVSHCLTLDAFSRSISRKPPTPRCRKLVGSSSSIRPPSSVSASGCWPPAGCGACMTMRKLFQRQHFSDKRQRCATPGMLAEQTYMGCALLHGAYFLRTPVLSTRTGKSRDLRSKV